MNKHYSPIRTSIQPIVTVDTCPHGHPVTALVCLHVLDGADIIYTRMGSRRLPCNICADCGKATAELVSLATETAC
jgi:hypothetical protein